MVRPRRLAALACLTALAAAGCGGGSDGDSRPQVGVEGDEREAASDLGFPAFATKNTTRVGGADSIANAAAVARAVYPGTEADTRPKAVALVDSEDWRGGVAAAALFAKPIGAPVLLTEGDDMPAATQSALDALSPTGSREAGGAQVIRVGEVAEPDGLKATDVGGGSPAEVAAQIDAILSEANGRSSDVVMVVGSDKPEFAVPAAGWAARSGNPVLFSDRDTVPTATKAALERHQQPDIYLLAPPSSVSKKAERELRRFGTVARITEVEDPVAAAIAFAREDDPALWQVFDPGHGLVFVNRNRPLDAVAAAPLSGSGTYGPTLLHSGGPRLDVLLDGYLQDIRPGYRRNPVRGVYNHGWIVGDEEAMPIATQARIDSLLEITLERLPGNEP
ncbi:MAG TPA: cell wall-binding repeat-containing protein, partial [Solirubrobacteraceae bacterium]|nr:cell wall-binding repeat-containing protein [Solirubrobacteraceae bacterium]